MTGNTHNRAHQPFDVRDGFASAAIWSDATDNAVLIGEVYDKGPGSYDHEEMAKVWAASYPIMLPALANIRNVARRAAETDRYETAEGLRTLLAAIAKTAADVLPVPTIGDLNGTSPPPPTPEATNADSLIATAKRLAWARHKAVMGEQSDTDEGTYWAWLSENYPQQVGVWLSVARAVAGWSRPHVSTAARQIADLLVLSRLPDSDGRPSPAAAKARMERVRSVRPEDFGPFQKAVEDAMNEAFVVLTAIAAGDEAQSQPDAALVDALAAAPPAPSAWRPIEEAPSGVECLIDVVSPVTYRWLTYNPSSEQARKGVKGRWQRATEHGWENADLPVVGDWCVAAPVAENAPEGAEGGR